MKRILTFLFAVGAMFLAGLGSVQGQTYTEYKFIFKGTAYQTNAAGNIVAKPITDQDLLASRAVPGGITDLSTVAIVYHIGGNAGDPEPGDTVDIIYTNNPAVLTTEYSLWFGSTCCGRTAVSNAVQSEAWRADYIYTQDNSLYTFANSDSVGLCLTHKVNVTDTNGFANSMITGHMSYGVAPQGTNGPIVIEGDFSLGEPLY